MRRHQRARVFLFLASMTLLCVCPASVSAQGKKTAQTAQASVFACLPKAERARAEKLLSACAPAYARAAKAVKQALDPVIEKASGIVERSALDRLFAADVDGDPQAESDLGELLASLEKECEAAKAALKEIAPPAEAKALAALLRSKASRNDLASLAKAEAALIACFPARQRPALKELGARFKSGGAASYVGYIACLCESSLIDPAPFEKLIKAEASSLNNSAAAKAAIRRIVSALSVQRTVLTSPWHFAYPPSLLKAAGDVGEEARRESLGAFFTLAEYPWRDWLSTPWFLDEGMASFIADRSAFLSILPDARVKGLEREAGRELVREAGRELVRAGTDAASLPEEEELRRALGLIADFETAMSGTDAEVRSRAAFAMLADRAAHLLLGNSGRYAPQRDACLAYLASRLEALAGIAYPGQPAKARAGFEGDALGAAIVLEDSGGTGRARIVKAGELADRLKDGEGTKQDQQALAFVVRPERLVSLEPLRFLKEAEASAFAWRCLSFGGKR